MIPLRLAKPSRRTLTCESPKAVADLVVAPVHGDSVEPVAHGRTIDGLVIARVSAYDGCGVAWVAFPGLSGCHLQARAMCSMDSNRIGTECVVMFEGGNPDRPVILGFLCKDVDIGRTKPVDRRKLRNATVDGRRITFDGEEEIVLRCGKASITLTLAGKVLIQGEYVLSRAHGANLVQGGTLKFN